MVYVRGNGGAFSAYSRVDSNLSSWPCGDTSSERGSYGLTTIIVTHDPQIAEFVSRIVAIRDGKTSTEIKEERGEYEEYVVLDSAGRLQVPKEYLERFRIKDRAKLELADEGILIRPVEGRRGE